MKRWLTMAEALQPKHNFTTFTPHQSLIIVKLYVVIYVRTSSWTYLHFTIKKRINSSSWRHSRLALIFVVLRFFHFGTTVKVKEILGIGSHLGKSSINKSKPWCRQESLDTYVKRILSIVAHNKDNSIRSVIYIDLTTKTMES